MGAVVSRVGDGVSIEVGVTQVALGVAVGVELREVRSARAVVAGGAYAVTVAVELIFVRSERTIVVVIGDAVAIGVIGVRQRGSVIGVELPGVSTAAAAVGLWRRAAARAEAFGVAGVHTTTNAHALTRELNDGRCGDGI